MQSKRLLALAMPLLLFAALPVLGDNKLFDMSTQAAPASLDNAELHSKLDEIISVLGTVTERQDRATAERSAMSSRLGSLESEIATLRTALEAQKQTLGSLRDYDKKLQRDVNEMANNWEYELPKMVNESKAKSSAATASEWKTVNVSPTYSSSLPTSSTGLGTTSTYGVGSYSSPVSSSYSVPVSSSVTYSPVRTVTSYPATTSYRVAAPVSSGYSVTGRTYLPQRAEPLRNIGRAIGIPSYSRSQRSGSAPSSFGFASSGGS